MLDLHAHTTYSDGSLTPAELVSAAKTAHLQALAITDHDTIGGWKDAITAAGTDLEIVPGLELSTSYGGRSLHILGYYPDPEKLAPPLEERLAGRHRRAARIAHKLAVLGYPIELPQLKGGQAPGRPHLAKALIQAGHATSMQEAFRRWLRDDGPAYVNYEKFSAVEGITLLRDCGAVPVWAHPYLFRGGKLDDVMAEMVEAGLMGIEVYHPGQRLSQQENLLAWCERAQLIATGGSDYHGPDSGVELTSLNQFKLPLAILEQLKTAATSLSTSANRLPMGGVPANG
ncbi:MAG: PHP domain-containing protein [Cyanobacteria bacterium P01_H01_bin.15]